MPEWYESFFTRLAVDFWRAAVPPGATLSDAELVMKELRVAPPARLLDLPCGSGRHVAELRARGFDVTGFDLSPAAVEGVPHCHVGDMRDRVPGGPYDGAYCLGNSFGYLGADDTRRFMRNVREAVKAGGRWLIDASAVAEAVLPYAPMERTLEAGGVRFFVRARYEEPTREIVQDATLTRGEQHEQSQIRYRVFTLAELRAWLQECGFRPLPVDVKGRVLLLAEAA